MHTRGQVIQFIEKIFGPAKLSNGGLNVSVVCPNRNCPSVSRNKKKLVIRTDNFLVHCWVCGIKSKNLYNILRKYIPGATTEFRETFLGSKEINLIDDIEENYVEELRLPKGFILLAEVMNDSSTEIKQAIWYLKHRRKILDRDFWYFKYGITLEDERYKNRIIIPSFDEEGDLNFFTTRSIRDKISLKSVHCNQAKRTGMAFNEINVDWSEELTIVEGPFDLVRCNDNATCMLGSDLDENHYLFQKIVENHTPVVLAYDDDAIVKMYNTANLLSQYNVPVRIFDLPQGVHDVGEMKKEQFISLLPYAKMFNADDYLKYRIALL